jgi:hypothetical protein
MPAVNYLAVLVSGIVIFLLGGLWYSPVLFARRWMALQGKTMAEIQASGGASPMMYVQVFVCGLLVSVAMALLLSHFPEPSVGHAIFVAFVAWLGFAAATSYGTALFSSKPKGLWAIDSGFNLASFVLAAVVLAAWR